MQICGFCGFAPSRTRKIRAEAAWKNRRRSHVHIPNLLFCPPSGKRQPGEEKVPRRERLAAARIQKEGEQKYCLAAPILPAKNHGGTTRRTTTPIRVSNIFPSILFHNRPAVSLLPSDHSRRVRRCPFGTSIRRPPQLTHLAVLIGVGPGSRKFWSPIHPAAVDAACKKLRFHGLSRLLPGPALPAAQLVLSYSSRHLKIPTPYYHSQANDSEKRATPTRQGVRLSCFGGVSA